MPKIGYKHTEEAKEKMSKSHLKYRGILSPWYGRHHSEKSKKLIGERGRGRSAWNKGLPQTDTAKLKNSLAHKGKTPWNKGRRMSEKQKVKLRLANLGKKQTEETKIKRGLYNRGAKSCHWKGGITSLRHLLRDSHEYLAWRSKVFERDHFDCIRCGKHGGNLHAHHIKKFSILLKDALHNVISNFYEACLRYAPLWDIANGLTLCKKCHKKEHSHER
jgi:hypothetical protein